MAYKRKDVRDRAMRVNALFRYALDRLKEGYPEDVIFDELYEMARRNWGVSYNTAKDYASYALDKAKDQFRADQSNPLTWTPPKASPPPTPQTKQPQEGDQDVDPSG